MIGEIAAEIKQSAARALSGEPAPEPAPVPQDYMLVITIAALCAASVAVVLGGIGLYRNEPHRLSYLAVGFSFSAFVMQFVFWLAIIICGIVLLVSIIGNLDSIVSQLSCSILPHLPLFGWSFCQTKKLTYDAIIQS